MMINKRFTSIFISLILMGSVLLLGTLPTFAATTTTIDGIEYEVITITQQNLIDMFNNGDISATIQLIDNNGGVVYNLYNLSDQSKTTVTMEQGQIDNYNITSASAAPSQYVLFHTPYVYSLRNGSELYQHIAIVLPFDHYFKATDIYYRPYYSGDSIDGYFTTTAELRDSNNQTIASQIRNTQLIYEFWSTDYWINTLYQMYQWVPEGLTYNNNATTGIRTNYAIQHFVLTSDDVVSSLSIVSNVFTDRTAPAGVRNALYAPLSFSIQGGFDVYVLPEMEGFIREYLGLVSGSPSSSDQQRINELKSEMNSNAQALSDAADDLHKDMPDLPDVTDLPEEVTDGVGEASEIVITPLMGIGVVNILVIVAISFSAIKLILYGSGPY